MAKHPAKFSDGILAEFARWLPDGKVFDPFAGTGKIHQLATTHRQTYGYEIEPEWAVMHPHTEIGNALSILYPAQFFDAIATSPCYGNRMADHHEAKDDSRRITYTHYLGRPLSEGNSGAMQWGQEYKNFHYRAWVEAIRVLKPGGRFLLNISDHVRDGHIAPVTAWHWSVLDQLGLRTIARIGVPTKRMRFGENHEARVKEESVIVFEKPPARGRKVA